MIKDPFATELGLSHVPRRGRVATPSPRRNARYKGRGAVFRRTSSSVKSRSPKGKTRASPLTCVKASSTSNRASCGHVFFTWRTRNELWPMRPKVNPSVDPANSKVCVDATGAWRLQSLRSPVDPSPPAAAAAAARAVSV